LREGEEIEPGYSEAPHGTCRVQTVRSVSDWSHGVLTEHSIRMLVSSSSHEYVAFSTDLPSVVRAEAGCVVYDDPPAFVTAGRAEERF